jgi:hypothetical protein
MMPAEDGVSGAVRGTAVTIGGITGLLLVGAIRYCYYHTHTHTHCDFNRFG